jgi:hypothetical protein
MDQTKKVTNAIETLGDAMAEEYGDWAKVTLISFMAALGRKDRTILVLPKEFCKFEGISVIPNGLIHQNFADALIELSDRTADTRQNMWDSFRQGFGISDDSFNMELMENVPEEAIDAEVKQHFDKWLEELGISQLLNPEKV